MARYAPIFSTTHSIAKSGLALETCWNKPLRMDDLIEDASKHSGAELSNLVSGTLF